MWGGEFPIEWHHFLGQVILRYVRMEKVSRALTGVHECLLLCSLGVVCFVLRVSSAVTLLRP